MSKHVYSIRPGRDWVYCERCGAVNADKETECRGVLPTVATREPLWPVGSLQWAMQWAMASGKQFRRRGEGDAFWCALHNDAVAWADSRNDQRDLTTADLVALDWEIYEEGGNGSV